MQIKDLYDLMEKKENWFITVYIEEVMDNILAYANSYYDIEGTKNKGDGIFKNPYSVKDLFSCEVVSFHAGIDGISIRIMPWNGMKTSAGEIWPNIKRRK